MKKLIVIITLCVALAQLSYAQQTQLFRHNVLTGKYTLDLLHNISESNDTITLESNLPGLVKANIKIAVLQNDGRIVEIKVNKLLQRKNNTLYCSHDGIQQIEILSFDLQYTEFGENYNLRWNKEWGQLNLIKGGVSYDYAQTAHLENTSFHVVKPSPIIPKPLPIPYIVLSE
jgi:hypothetical protein